MIIGERIRDIRESKKLSQGDIERRTGLLRCYVSRVENGHTVPAVETLEKFARALEIPMYQLVYDADRPHNSDMDGDSVDNLWGSVGKDARYLRRLKLCLARMRPDQRDLILLTLQGMLRKKR
jgi:transcriptional regulator with XRE-family HTH domain